MYFRYSISVEDKSKSQILIQSPLLIQTWNTSMLILITILSTLTYLRFLLGLINSY